MNANAPGKITRILWEGMGFGWAETAYTAVAAPLMADALERAHRLGFPRVLVLPYLLFTGRLVEQVRATVADNGLRALEFLSATHDFDAVLMDCQMPEMDGLEATRRARAHERASGSHVPIIALTANAMVGDREQCLDAGMDDFLSKPFQLRDLSAALDRWCPAVAGTSPDTPQEIPA